MGNGTVVIKFCAIDKPGNINSSEIFTRKDAYVPEITINSPLDNEIFERTPPEYNISIIEKDLTVTWYTIEEIAECFFFSELNGKINQNAWNEALEGEIIIAFSAQNAAGNIVTKNLQIKKRTYSNSAEELPLVITSIVGAIGVSGVGVVIFRKRISNIKKYTRPLIKKIKKSFRRNAN